MFRTLAGIKQQDTSFARLRSHPVLGVMMWAIALLLLAPAMGSDTASAGERVGQCFNPVYTSPGTGRSEENQTCQVLKALGPELSALDLHRVIVGSLTSPFRIFYTGTWERLKRVPSGINDAMDKVGNVYYWLFTSWWFWVLSVALLGVPLLLVVIDYLRYLLDRVGLALIALLFAMFLAPFLLLAYLLSAVVIPAMILLLMPFIFLALGAKEGCRFDRAIFCCIDLGGRDEVPLNYYVLPAFVLMWMWRIKKFVMPGNQAQDSKEVGCLQWLGGLCCRLQWLGEVWCRLQWLWELCVSWYDVASDLSMALRGWKVLPLWWSLSFAPTLVLSVFNAGLTSVRMDSLVDPAMQKRRGILSLLEDVPQAILSGVSIVLCANAGVEQSPFAVTSLINSTVGAVLLCVQLCGQHGSDEVMAQVTSDSGHIYSQLDGACCDKAGSSSDSDADTAHQVITMSPVSSRSIDGLKM